MALKKILLAIDDERFGKEIVDFVVGYNWTDGVVFRFLHVIELSQAFDLPEVAIEESRRSASALIKQLSDFIRRSIPGAHIEETVVTGQAKEEIINSAKAWPADLIVMGSHGRRSLLGLGIFLLGSVSQAVSSHASCSVVIVRLPREGSGEVS